MITFIAGPRTFDVPLKKFNTGDRKRVKLDTALLAAFNAPATISLCLKTLPVATKKFVTGFIKFVNDLNAF